MHVLYTINWVLYILNRIFEEKPLVTYPNRAFIFLLHVNVIQYRWNNWCTSTFLHVLIFKNLRPILTFFLWKHWFAHYFIENETISTPWAIFKNRFFRLTCKKREGMQLFPQRLYTLLQLPVIVYWKHIKNLIMLTSVNC